MPPVGAGDLLAVRVDVAAFVALATLSALLGWIFYVAISLGLARAVLMTFLAWFQARRGRPAPPDHQPTVRSEEHTSELQSLMRISYAVFCLKKKTKKKI